MLVTGEPLTHHEGGGIAPPLVRRRRPRLHEALHTTVLEPVGQRVPLVEVPVACAGVEGGGDQNQSRHALWPRQCERERGVRSHRGARDRRSLDTKAVEHGLEVAGEVRVVVGAALGGGVRLAVAARVVGHDPVSVRGQEARTHHHIPPRGSEPVEQNNRIALARLLPAEGRGTAVQLELEGLFDVGHCWSEARERCNV